MLTSIKNTNTKELKINYSNHFLQRYLERFYDISASESEKYINQDRSGIVKLANDLLKDMKLIYSGYTKLNEKEDYNYYVKSNILIVASKNMIVNGITNCTVITLYKPYENKKDYIKELECLYKRKIKQINKGLFLDTKITEEKIKECLNSIKYCEIEMKKKNEFDLIHKEQDHRTFLELLLARLEITKPEVPMTCIKTMDGTVTWEYPKSKSRKYCRA